MRTTPSLVVLLLALPVALIATQTASAVSIDWVTIADAGNACETQSQGCFGAVASTYRIGRTEVTNAQYADFLNAVAATDPNGLYNTSMASVASHGGITRSGSSGSYVYNTIAGREDMPVLYTSFWDALRFANWLHHGQPVGNQGGSTTEGGAYTITAQGITDNSIVRNPGANVYISSEDEWYKAAFYDSGSGTYNNYPSGSNSQTVCASPTATANRANCNDPGGDLTIVESYSGSASPYGVFDLGGNAFEWNDTIISGNRGTRGGNFGSGVGFLAASNRNILVGPGGTMGFRVTSPAAPPPAVPLLGPLAIGLLVTLLGVSGSRRRTQAERSIQLI